ncbi:MAG TPA: hypothetical protein DEP88_10750 [Verrucomicrobiales bacterium]|nr:hypothetical protein [Verrucomicrobiales bacterium]HCL97845.1 hypothetical protein [Verrucomicrobiales bacterium]|tara:strand:- start:544 stop:750 length:207 start_codon:yes stop_codon:yes gene_type:complete
MFDPYDILAWVIFGSFGMVYVAYGKWKDLWQPKLLGFGLMFLPYFTPSGFWLWTVGVILLFAIFIARD